MELVTAPLKNITKHKYGQYFTPKFVADFMVSLADIIHTSKILEPSAGKGVFIDSLLENGYSDIDAYEIDKELIHNHKNIINKSFISTKFNNKYDLIIGNPPFIRWKNLEEELKEELIINPLWLQYFNSLCDYLYIFILKSIELLKENGQLIFICPEYWLNTKHSQTLRDYMISNGYFEEIIHFNETKIFDNATVSIIIFKYIKSKSKVETIHFTKYYKQNVLTKGILDKIRMKINSNDIETYTLPQFKIGKRWILSKLEQNKKNKLFENTCSKKQFNFDLFGDSIGNQYDTIGDICEIGNGMVSGLDKVFQLNGEELNEYEKNSRIDVLKAKDLRPYGFDEITKYIFVQDVEDEEILKNGYPNFYNKLVKNKNKLDRRYHYGKDIPYWHWVFPRNFNLFSKTKDRIFVPCKERISNKDHFRFTYVPAGIYPTQDVTALFLKDDVKESIFYVLAFLNNYRVFEWLKSNGVIKGNIVEFSEKPLMSIPFKKIDWENLEEVKVYNEIVYYSQSFIKNNEVLAFNQINELFNQLLK